MNAVAVAMDQVAGENLQPAQFHRLGHFHNMSVSVRYGNIPREKMKSLGLHSGQIANRAVGHVSYRDRPVHF